MKGEERRWDESKNSIRSSCEITTLGREEWGMILSETDGKIWKERERENSWGEGLKRRTQSRSIFKKVFGGRVSKTFRDNSRQWIGIGLETSPSLENYWLTKDSKVTKTRETRKKKQLYGDWKRRIKQVLLWSNKNHTRGDERIERRQATESKTQKEGPVKVKGGM